ncbi:MAG: glycosyltransferase [Schwartzia sp.]|nr:glycosyltransferase [Schwartzia sp. (in: firmicutes)]
MKISVCYIAKNEEKNLPLSLETVRGLGDELIVVDTGSTDATQKIAEGAGARIYSFTWRDDFAAARNFALEHATGDWIVFLDADEGFLYPDSVREKIQEIAAVLPPVDAVMVTRVNMDFDATDTRGTDRAARIFRNLPEIRYHGRIHETISHARGKLRFWQDDGALSLYHTGYAGEIGRQKAERNLRLLLADIKVGGEQPGQYMYLADCYMGLQDWQKSLKYALLALNSPVQPAAGRVGLFHVAIESMRQLDWPLDEQLALAEKARDEYPKQPEFYGERGMILCGMGRLEEARSALETALTLYENHAAPATASTYFTDATAAVVKKRLDEIAALLDK